MMACMGVKPSATRSSISRCRLNPGMTARPHQLAEELAQAPVALAQLLSRIDTVKRVEIANDYVLSRLRLRPWSVGHIVVVQPENALALRDVGESGTVEQIGIFLFPPFAYSQASAPKDGRRLDEGPAARELIRHLAIVLPLGQGPRREKLRQPEPDGRQCLSSLRAPDRRLGASRGAPHSIDSGIGVGQDARLQMAGELESCGVRFPGDCAR